MIGGLLRRLGGGSTPAAAPPLWVRLSVDQPHPIDLAWVDELVERVRGHVVVRPEDELLILVPNRPVKLNATALRILQAMIDEGVGIAEVLAREGDGVERRRRLHEFFTDLRAWLDGSLGEGAGRRAVEHEAFAPGYAAYPVLSEVALTYRCNLTCAFCYAGCAAAGLPDGWSEDRTLSDDDVCRVLEVIRRDARCPSVSFTGGEPTVRPALPRFVAHAKSLGMKVNLISNGLLLDDARCDALAGAGLDSAQLSLEGPTAAVHDGLVRRPGAFERLWAGARRLRERGIRVHTNTTINRRNLEHARDIVEEIARRGHDRLTMNLVIPCGAAAGEDDLRVPYSEIGETLLAVAERARELGVLFVWYSPIPLCRFNTAAHGLGSPGCAAADGLLHVDPAGDVLPCSSFRHSESLGNLLESPFDQIWGGRAARFFRAKEMTPPGCADCSSRAVCQGACPLYWREVGLGELGGGAEDGPPLPAGFEGALGRAPLAPPRSEPHRLECERCRGAAGLGEDRR